MSSNEPTLHRLPCTAIQNSFHSLFCTGIDGVADTFGTLLPYYLLFEVPQVSLVVCILGVSLGEIQAYLPYLKV